MQCNQREKRSVIRNTSVSVAQVVEALPDCWHRVRRIGLYVSSLESFDMKVRFLAHIHRLG